MTRGQVNTATLALAAGLSIRTIQRLAKQGTITPLDVHTAGHRGRPTMWFDLNTTMRILDARRRSVVN